MVIVIGVAVRELPKCTAFHDLCANFDKHRVVYKCLNLWQVRGSPLSCFLPNALLLDRPCVPMSHLPLEVVAEIIDLVAACYPRSLLASCTLVSRDWNVPSVRHLSLAKTMFQVFSPISRLPIELLDEIIDLVVEHNRDSLSRCALVSRRWNSRATYHLQRLVTKPCRHAQITATPELHAFLDAIKKDAYLAQYTRSLSISPNLEASPSTSYIPFIHLSSRTLPNIGRLVLGEGLRWSHYPQLYNNGAVGSSFHSVGSLDLCCQFRSTHDLFRAVRSFRNLRQVRLLHPDPFPPAAVQIAARRGAHALGPIRLRRPLRSLEVPVSLIQQCSP